MILHGPTMNTLGGVLQAPAHFANLHIPRIQENLTWSTYSADRKLRCLLSTFYQLYATQHLCPVQPSLHHTDQDEISVFSPLFSSASVHSGVLTIFSPSEPPEFTASAVITTSPSFELLVFVESFATIFSTKVTSCNLRR